MTTLTLEKYRSLQDQALNNPEEFWAREANAVTWFKPWETLTNGDFLHGNIEWFLGGELNICYNCLDRHLNTLSDKPAIIWQSDDLKTNRILTYRTLHKEVCRFASILITLGLRKGDSVCIYLPMIPEAAIAMLACARLGIIHIVVFAGFSPESLRDRITNANAKLVITADQGQRGGKIIPLKENVDIAIKDLPIHYQIVIKHTGQPVAWQTPRDKWYHDLIETAESFPEAVSMQSEDPFFILYTSGSTGKPKGLLHTTGGFFVYALCTFKYVFDIKSDDVFWCTADIGWITGHTYAIYAALGTGTTTVLYEGTPTYPTYSSYWEIIDRYQVTIFYTSPTALRALMRFGDEPIVKANLSSLRLLGTVGEPINPEVWKWFYQVIGQSRCPIVDTWWQTETGGIMMTPLPGVSHAKPGAAMIPFFGIKPMIVDQPSSQQSGLLLIANPWPAIARTIWKDHERYIKTYFAPYPGFYFTADGAFQDKEGDYWITGRVDDVINVSGHRIGTSEVESALVSHPLVIEAAVIAIPHEVKGQCIIAFVSCIEYQKTDHIFKQLLKEWVGKSLHAMYKPEDIYFIKDLPKTRSGKVMRRILRELLIGSEDFGDISTLTNPESIEAIRELIDF